MANNEEFIEFNLPAPTHITEDGKLKLFEVTVTYKGIWRVHLTDPDIKFPSDFHADRVDSPEKLDIYTGQVYDKKTKQPVYNLSGKEMRFIYRELFRQSKENSSIRTHLNDLSRFNYLN